MANMRGSEERLAPGATGRLRLTCSAAWSVAQGFFLHDFGGAGGGGFVGEDLCVGASSLLAEVEDGEEAVGGERAEEEADVALAVVDELRADGAEDVVGGVAEIVDG